MSDGETLDLTEFTMPTADQLAAVSEFVRRVCETMTAIARAVGVAGSALGDIFGRRGQGFWGEDAPVVFRGEDGVIEIAGPAFGPRLVPLAYVHRGTTFSTHRDVAGCRVVGENGACVDTFVTLEAWLNMPPRFKREARWLRDVERVA